MAIRALFRDRDQRHIRWRAGGAAADDGARLQSLSLGPVLPELEVGDGPLLPYRRFCRSRREPEEIVYDRMKTVVASTDVEGALVYNLSLIALANHHGYQPRACPATPSGVAITIERRVSKTEWC